MIDKDQVYMYNREEVKVHQEVTGMPDLVIVLQADGYGQWIVARKKDLVKKEDSYEYKRAKERADEIRLITAKAQENFDKLTNKLVDNAIRALASRIKFNVAFGEGGLHSGYAIMLSTELEKMIKKEAPKLLEKKDELFT